MNRDNARRLRLLLVLPLLVLATNAAATLPTLGYGWS